MSENLNHNVPVIWALLKPVMKLLPSSVENVYFLSDGPVTQYRNKDMFFYLLCKLTETYPNIYDFTWNYHEAGHGKGAPDGIGVYTDSEKDVQNKIVAQTSTHVINTIDNADTAMTVKNRDFVLVEYNINNKKYRYAGVCSSDFDEEEGEIRVTFLKISNKDATLFRINDNDMSDVKWEQILTILPVPKYTYEG
ncbi:unnamed protein product, partial [Brenthis ino]